MDRKGANHAIELPSDLIGAMMEDASEIALRVRRHGSTHGELLKVGQDIVALATAIEVVERRTDRTW